ncbi:class I SAM-dependent methyltransferase [Corallococcus exiguus]|uniref:Methyltransferase domain-containing protein n=2 Tax=Corallococcus exiguus TaxID=83462 RepID=A0A7X5BY34_9BACT|nr:MULTISPECIES: class I SAM-dependent methyltransferase [Corallococcus]NBC45763.1 methyltransferase domain-containing protein [Corallococcus exiguus]NNC18953.1 class I SAM-dependent methyltransferase [Corallococcus exiguus]RKH27497.1 class I SAM-dependent methyltransferase [Corallococcus sp. CA041A]RKI12678.1 class I SAM-dependent methyltransferase [Corallococcus sp. AB030]RUO91970.1 class I SAM-dependent methyltransferase [Corallococcus sp. AB018]
MKALAYDALMAPLGWVGLNAARRQLVEGLSGKVLEVGAGTGLALPGYPDSVTSVTAVDVDLGALVRARARRSGVALLQADAQALPFTDGSFDAVVSSLVFCCVDAPGTALSEVMRVLKPGGELRLLEHVRAPNLAVATAQDLLTPAWRKLTGGCRLNRDTFRLVETTGFHILRREQRLGGVGEFIFARRP